MQEGDRSTYSGMGRVEERRQQLNKKHAVLANVQSCGYQLDQQNLEGAWSVTHSDTMNCVVLLRITSFQFNDCREDGL